MRRVAAIGLLLAAACTEPATEPTPPDGPTDVVSTSDSWRARADFPTGIFYAASTSITTASTLRTTVYVIGGQHSITTGPGSITDAVKAYDVSANRWRTKARYPVPVRGPDGAAEIDGKIYVPGGFTRVWDPQRGSWRMTVLSSLYVYNPATDQWTTKRDMPITTAVGVSAAYKGRLYVATGCYDRNVCGDASEGAVGALWRYTPETDRWVLLSRTPHDPSYGGGGFIGGRLYLVDDLGSTDVYDVATNTWSTGPQRPIRYCTPASTTLQAKLYLVGCRDDFDGTGVYPMLVLDPKAGIWSQAAAPPVAATGHLWTLSRTVGGLELVGGTMPGNNWNYVP